MGKVSFSPMNSLGGNCLLARCFGFQFLFEIGPIIFEGSNRGIVGRREVAFELLILHGGEGRRDRIK